VCGGISSKDNRLIGEKTMKQDDHDNTNMPVLTGDGFDDSADETNDSIIKGTKLKFTLEYKWVAGDVEISPERELLAVGFLKIEQKWIPGQDPPAETRILAPNEEFRNIPALNKKAPREEWQERFGEPRGPWQAAQVVYLLDRTTMEIFTYIAPTPMFKGDKSGNFGGTRAIRELRESTKLARRVHGAPVYAVVTLTDTPMKTSFGGRQRPHFQIVRFDPIGDPPRRLEKPSAPKQPPPESADEVLPESKTARTSLAGAKAKLKPAE
jgi:hypothetical protein